jgi:hypothetical protein
MRFMGFPELREGSADIVHRTQKKPRDARGFFEGCSALPASTLTGIKGRPWLYGAVGANLHAHTQPVGFGVPA